MSDEGKYLTRLPPRWSIRFARVAHRKLYKNLYAYAARRPRETAVVLEPVSRN